ncbi:MAG: hypothetical protein JNM17_15870 [Archangium sp.]|nr:hypothetical protein [Archangium sp.]
MSEHLSALQLDEQAMGSPANPHLASCGECTAKLEALKKQNAVFLARADAKSFEAKLLEKHVAPPPSRLSRVVLMIAPLAAAVLLFVVWPKADPVVDGGDRVKGAPLVMLLDARGAPVTTANVGDELSLALRFSGTEARKVTVSAIDANGKREELWSGSVPPNERAVISKLKVTPGNVEVVADFAPPPSQSLRVGVTHDTASTKLEVK